MKNSLFDHVDSNIQNAKQTIAKLFKNCNPQTHQQHQINFQQILFQKTDILDNQQSNKTQMVDIKLKLQNAIRNSTIAKIVYHNQDPQRLAQKFLQTSQVFKQLENQISFNNLSTILDLKIINQNDQQKNQISGLLLKYSPSLFGGWTQRYCIVTKDKFVYHESKDPNSPVAGFLNFNILSFSIQIKYQALEVQSFEIKVEKGEKNFIFKGLNCQETLKWYKKLNQTITQSDGKYKSIICISNYPRFWRKDYIAQKQFQETAQTGDILLFRGKKTSALLQRAISGQEYDHIGVVLLNSFDQILIFEANGGFGVGICPWKKFIKNQWFQDQQIIATRHLKINRTQPLINQIIKFVQNNIGKQYKFSFKNYILSRNSEVQNDKSSYFCSSLVAKLYKTLGLLDKNISSSRYMPYDFCEKGNLKILKGKYGQGVLQRQKIIVFERKKKTKIFSKNT